MDVQRSIVGITLAGLVLIIGTKIPLPGLDMSVVSAQGSMSGSDLSRFSIFALGLMPLHMAFSLVEIGRLFVRESGGRSERPGPLEVAIISLIALAMTVLQGYGIVGGLRSGGLIDADAAYFPFVTIATYMGATALLLLLCFRVHLPGFRNGFWALWAVPVLLTLASEVMRAIEETRTGVVWAGGWLLLAGYLVLTIGAVVFISKLWQSVCKPAGEPVDWAEPREILIWPPVLAGVVTTLALTLLAIMAPNFVNLLSIWFLPPFVFGVTALIIPIFVWAYAVKSRSMFKPGAPIVAVTACIAVVQMLLVIVGGLVGLLGGLPLSIGFIAILAIAVTGLGLQGAALPVYFPQQKSDG